VCVGPFVRSEEAEVQWVKVAGDVEISVSGLSPATNYTLLVYAENSSGRSPAAFIVYATTGGQRSPIILLSEHVEYSGCVSTEYNALIKPHHMWKYGRHPICDG